MANSGLSVTGRARELRRAFAALVALTLAACQSEAPAFLCYSLPGKDGAPVEVTEHVPCDDSFIEYDVGNVKLTVYVEVHPEGIRDKGERVRETCDHYTYLISDNVSSPRVLKEEFRKQEQVGWRRVPIARDGFEGVDQIYESPTPSGTESSHVFRIVAGTWHVVTITAYERSGSEGRIPVSSDSLTAFLDSLNLHEESVTEWSKR